ncbi:MAG: fused MFS/spermidine synthase [Gammaproteobacteria bacterium]|nr:fused MFS/spermidine synthase [Gammaproteobacteria bacterium]
MGKYQGILIHRVHTGEDYLDVVDYADYRSLHFNSRSIQSRMLLSDPDRLVLEYTEAMMLALAWQPEPKRVLLLGLGGGSQARYLLRHFPECQLDAIEVLPRVTELAREFFSLPDTDRLTVYHMEAEAFMQSGHLKESYDLILADAFDHNGPVVSVFDETFLQALNQALAPDGVCVFNMWQTDARDYAEVCHRVQSAMACDLYDVPLTEDPENIVLIATQAASTQKSLLRHCKRLEKTSGIKLRRHLKHLSRLTLPEAS